MFEMNMVRPRLEKLVKVRAAVRRRTNNFFNGKNDTPDLPGSAVFSWPKRFLHAAAGLTASFRIALSPVFLMALAPFVLAPGVQPALPDVFHVRQGGIDDQQNAFNHLARCRFQIWFLLFIMGNACYVGPLRLDWASIADRPFQALLACFSPTLANRTLLYLN